MKRCRLRDLGIVTGALPPGPLNAITDVAGVEVGHFTLVQDHPHVVRTGVTAIWPRRDIWTRYGFAGCHSFNGNGEMTGMAWIAEQGLLCAPLAITNTHSVGVVRDAICAYATRAGIDQAFHLPVVGETYDGRLSDSERYPIIQDHAFAALDAAQSGPVAEGNVGGGTGMVCHEFKGGIGTASRRVAVNDTNFTVGALVQANYGDRGMLRIDGVPVGREIGVDIVPSFRPAPQPKGSSIIVILATDAPILPIQCQRLARRATTGLAWVGGYGANSSGDIFLAFTTANPLERNQTAHQVTMLAPDGMTPLFQAAAEATEEAILNALTAAGTMTGYQDLTIHALPLDRLQDVMRRYKRLA